MAGRRVCVVDAKGGEFCGFVFYLGGNEGSFTPTSGPANRARRLGSLNFVNLWPDVAIGRTPEIVQNHAAVSGRRIRGHLPLAGLRSLLLTPNIANCHRGGSRKFLVSAGDQRNREEVLICIRPPMRPQAPRSRG